MLHPTWLFIIDLLFLLVIWYFYQRYTGVLRVARWKKSLNVRTHYQVFTQLYRTVDGFALSHQARNKQDALEYTYGEIEFVSFIALLSLVKPNAETIFYDLGSGSGKAVLACVMVYSVQKSVGIELFPELYQSALTQKQKLGAIEHYVPAANKVTFILGSFLEIDLREANLIFINATAFIGSTWEQLNIVLAALPLLNTVITTSKPLLANSFFIEKTAKVQMSWGVVTAFIHQKKQI